MYVLYAFGSWYLISELQNTNMQIEKNVFVVFYSGEKVKNKILKICDAFGANRYSFSEDLGKQAQMITEVCIPILVEPVDYRLYDFF